MKYRIVYETTSTHECTVELPDDHFDDKSRWDDDIPECDGSCNLQEIQECQTISITDDKGNEVWQI